MHPFRFQHFTTLPSTQSTARQGVETGTYTVYDVIIADTQSAGFGRRGRAWQSPQGNLAMTFVEDFSDPRHLNWLGYAVGLALYDAVKAQILPSTALHLKWPNDVLLDSGKLAGLLLEICGDKMLVGIGMNVASLPETDQAVTRLADHACQPVTAMNIAEAFFYFYTGWHRLALEKGFSPLRNAWLDRAAFIGQTISARLANKQVITGRFNDIDGQGALVLTNESGHHVVTTADIYLPTD